MRSSRVLVMAVLFLACGGGGGDGGPGPGPTPAAVSISPGTLTNMTSIGDQASLTAEVRDANDNVINNATVTWTSSASTVASVAQTGRQTTVTAVGNGQTTITARSGTVTSSGVTLTVAQAANNVAITPANPSVQVGQTQQLTARMRDARNNNMTGTTFQYGSSDAAKVSVNAATGLVTANVVGTATITATATAGPGQGLTGTTVVTATAVPTFPLSATVTTTASNTFNPATVDIARTGTVTWNYGNTHNVTFSSANPAQHSTLATCTNAGGCSGDKTFNVVGTYNYECTNHAGMSGQVIVH
jgi:plastocyanin